MMPLADSAGWSTRGRHERRPRVIELLAWDHQVRRGRAGVHDPHSAFTPVVGKTERCGGRAWYGDRRVRPCARLVLAHQVVPDGSEHRLRARAVLFRSLESRLPLHAVRLALE